MLRIDTKSDHLKDKKRHITLFPEQFNLSRHWSVSKLGRNCGCLSVTPQGGTRKNLPYVYCLSPYNWYLLKSTSSNSKTKVTFCVYSKKKKNPLHQMHRRWKTEQSFRTARLHFLLRTFNWCPLKIILLV